MTDGSQPLLLGHRGARLCAPENTFAAFDQALAHGCDGFELDVRRTSDGRAFICHDARFCGRKIATASYSDLTRHRQTRTAKRGAPPLSPESFPCIEDVLQRYAAQAFLDIELKDSGLESAITVALRAHPPHRGYVVSSFLPEVIATVRRQDAGIPLGFICDRPLDLQKWAVLPVGYVMPHRSLVSRRLIEELHAAGKQVFVWTVNQQRTMLRLADWGADAIISDDTERLCRAFLRL